LGTAISNSELSPIEISFSLLESAFEVDIEALSLLVAELLTATQGD